MSVYENKVMLALVEAADPVDIYAYHKYNYNSDEEVSEYLKARGLAKDSSSPNWIYGSKMMDAIEEALEMILRARILQHEQYKNATMGQFDSSGKYTAPSLESAMQSIRDQAKARGE